MDLGLRVCMVVVVLFRWQSRGFLHACQECLISLGIMSFRSECGCTTPDHQTPLSTAPQKPPLMQACCGRSGRTAQDSMQHPETGWFRMVPDQLLSQLTCAVPVQGSRTQMRRKRNRQRGQPGPLSVIMH